MPKTLHAVQAALKTVAELEPPKTEPQLVLEPETGPEDGIDEIDAWLELGRELVGFSDAQERMIRLTLTMGGAR